MDSKWYMRHYELELYVRITRVYHDEDYFSLSWLSALLEPRETEREHCHSGIVNSLINRCTVSARCREGGVVRSPKTKYPLAVILVPGATQFSGQI